MTSPERPSKRADSALSTTSSGSRTVRPSSRSSRRRRRSSASFSGGAAGSAAGSAPGSGGGGGTPARIFARLTGKDKSGGSELDDEEDEADNNHVEDERKSDLEDDFHKQIRLWQSSASERNVVQREDNVYNDNHHEDVDDFQIPPKAWRQASDAKFRDDEDPEQGPSDYWHRSTSPSILDNEIHSFAQSSSSHLKPDSGHEYDLGKNDDTDSEINQDAVDETSYAQRLRDIFDPKLHRPAITTTTSTTSRRQRNVALEGIFGDPDSASTSMMTSTSMDGGLERGDETGSEKDVFASGKFSKYDEVYRDIVGEKAGGGDVDEEEFGALQSTPIPDSRDEEASDDTPSLSSRVAGHNYAPPGSKRSSYLHPSVSRLRSHLRSASSTSTQPSPPRGLHNRTPSHFSQVSMSRSDSISTASIAGPSRPAELNSATPDLSHSPQLGMDSGGASTSTTNGTIPLGPVFTFHPLRHLSAHLFGRLPQSKDDPDPPVSKGRGPSMLGLPLGAGDVEKNFGRPSVIDVRGVIAVGTEGGWAIIYGFGQNMKCVLGTESLASSSGPVTTITISPDQTFVGVGHAAGVIHLYDLSSPSRPARTVQPLALRQVLGGRKEGHLHGSSILHIGFVGKRHTSIVTGDSDGRAFWWSLGRVMGVESNDVVRMLGSYPDPSTTTPASSSSLTVQSSPGSPSSTPLALGNGSSPVDVAPVVHRKTASTTSSVRSHPTKRATTLFAALPLPLGDTPHPTDSFNFSALLTPGKLVVVAMKPSPKTWFRRMRESSGGALGGLTGCAAWLTVGEVDGEKGEGMQEGGKVRVRGEDNSKSKATSTSLSDPVLAYSWGSTVRFLRVRVGEDETPEFVEGKKWEAPSAIRAMQWFDQDHLLLVSSSSMILFNVRSMMAVEDTPLQTKLLAAHDSYSILGRRNNHHHHDNNNNNKNNNIPLNFAGSVRTHRSKLFLLTRSNVQVGSLQLWNDRILSRVHAGDFLGAISLALAYYDGRAKGNQISLPRDMNERKEIVGRRVRELIKASLDWAFSEERMRDDTHYSADGRGVDLTALFEGLASACVDAAVSMSDGSLLFDEAYDYFSNVGIQGILLSRLEPSFFQGILPPTPPHIVQALINSHDIKGEYALAEAVIWHADSSALDINQAINLCEKHGLWDALIHVYTRAMKDYVAPIVRLLALIREIEKARAQRPTLVGGKGGDVGDTFFEHMAPGAYKLYAYLEAVLCGCSYPSGQALDEIEAERARSEAYAFVFSDRTVSWPSGSTGQPVLTNTIANSTSPRNGIGGDGGEDMIENSVWSEPTYPYLRLLLRFDTEAFLHAMDGAFEDSYLNDIGRSNMSRQSIINLMLDVVDPVIRSNRSNIDHSALSIPGDSSHDFNSPTFHSSDITLLHIFVARNLPKYPQFIFIPPSTLHRILVSLTEDPDMSTTEDRQLAAESLLSAYTPHDSDAMLIRFEKAGFYRILRMAYEREHKWTKLISVLVKDPDVDQSVFEEIERIVAVSSGLQNGGMNRATMMTVTSGGVKAPSPPADVVDAVRKALPHLLEVSVRETAATIDRTMPLLHDSALLALSTSEHKQMAYLGVLLDPVEDDHSHHRAHATTPTHPSHPHPPLPTAPSSIPLKLRHLYATLLTKHNSSALVPFLDRRGPNFFDLGLLAEQSEDQGAVDAALWALDKSGQAGKAMRLADQTIEVSGSELANSVIENDQGIAHVEMEKIRAVVRMAVRLCREHSETEKGQKKKKKVFDNASDDDSMSKNEGGEMVDVEDMWYNILHAITELVHTVSAIRPRPNEDEKLMRRSSGAFIDGKTQRGNTTLASTDDEKADAVKVDEKRELDSDESQEVESLGSIVLDAVKAIVYETLGSLVSTSGALSFPRLFKRLVDPSSPPTSSSPSESTSTSSSTIECKPQHGGRAYAQFRTILRGMLDSYATEAEVLRLSVRLVGADTAELLGEAVKVRSRGWASWGVGNGKGSVVNCVVCGEKCDGERQVGIRGNGGKGKDVSAGVVGQGVRKVIVFADGRIKHDTC